VNRTWVVIVAALSLFGVVAATTAVPATPQSGHAPAPGHNAVGDAPTAKSSGATPPTEQLVSPEPEASRLWPYKSRTQSPDGRTLAINLVVTGEPDAVRRALTDRSGVDWSRVDDDGDVDIHESSTPWKPARGAARYSYVVSPNGSGQWVDATYQLGTGTYLGKCIHVRAYPAPSGNWTGVQAHGEYWDWFRLRHTVTSVPPAASFVGDDLANEPYVTNVSRQNHGLGGGGSSGWFIVVEFASLSLLVGSVGMRRDVDRPDVLVPAAILGVVLGVRLVGLGAEALLPATSPKLFAAVLYPVLVAGPPVAVAKLARDRPAVRTGVLAAGALAAALVLDASLVGLVDPPTRLVHHRLALVGVFGVLAGAIASDRPRTTVVGVLAWLLAFAAPLFGFL